MSRFAKARLAIKVREYKQGARLLPYVDKVGRSLANVGTLHLSHAGRNA